MKELVMRDYDVKRDSEQADDDDEEEGDADEEECCQDEIQDFDLDEVWRELTILFLDRSVNSWVVHWLVLKK